MEDDSVWYVIGDADKVIPARHPAQVCDACHVEDLRRPGGDHPSMIAHPEVTVDAIRDAANAVSVKRRRFFWSLLSIAHRLLRKGPPESGEIYRAGRRQPNRSEVVNPTRDTGFIQPFGGGGRDVFVHISAGFSGPASVRRETRDKPSSTRLRSNRGEKSFRG